MRNFGANAIVGLTMSIVFATLTTSCQKSEDEGIDERDIIKYSEASAKSETADIDIIGDADFLETTPEGYDVYEAIIKEDGGSRFVGSVAYYVDSEDLLVVAENRVGKTAIIRTFQPGNYTID